MRTEEKSERGVRRERPTTHITTSFRKKDYEKDDNILPYFRSQTTIQFSIEASMHDTYRTWLATPAEKKNKQRKDERRIWGGGAKKENENRKDQIAQHHMKKKRKKPNRVDLTRICFCCNISLYRTWI